jgi:hypothetical protein
MGPYLVTPAARCNTYRGHRKYLFFPEGLRPCKSVKISTSTCIAITVLSHITCLYKELKKIYVPMERSATNIRTVQEIGHFNGLLIRMSQFFIVAWMMDGVIDGVINCYIESAYFWLLALVAG